MILIEQAEAIQFDRVMSAGRTTPLLLTCEMENDEQIEVVVKFATGRHCTMSSLCAELIASQLAIDLGLPTPAPLIVTWRQEFVDSLIEPEARQIVTASTPPAFGSTFVTGGFSSWSTDRKLSGAAMRHTALAIFFFDAMIGNSDRGGIKPNILVRGDSFRLIDHEMAFRDYMLLAKPTPPWMLGSLNEMVIPGAHIFATELIKGAKELEFGPIRAAWAGLSDRQVEDYVAAIPPEWTVGQGLTEFAMGRIKNCRDRIDECVTECRRALDVGT
ncbi:MAG: HipA family kinase [Rhizobiaceae bacterium]